MKICVIGLGFVGLSLASVLGSKGYKIIGIDIDDKKCKKISSGHSPFFEPKLEETLKKGLKKDLGITNNLSLIKDCDYIFVTVGTPQRANGAIDLSMIKNAVTSIGEILKQTKKNLKFCYTRRMENYTEKLFVYFYQKTRESFVKSVRELIRINLSLVW